MNYTDLEVWIEARKLANTIYSVSKSHPKEEIFGLTHQMRRCAVSVPSNIAEGIGRKTSNDTLRFLYISRGSLFELETQIYISADQNYLDDKAFHEILQQILLCKKLIGGFINYYKNIN